MGLWDGMLHEDGQKLANDLAAYRPFVGRKIRVVEGRKYRGQLGVVFWHGQDTKSHALRYCDSYARAIIEAQGRYGYRIGVIAQDGSKFFIAADRVMVAVE